MDYWPSYIPKPSSLSESVDDPYIEATSETGDDAARVRSSKERQGPTKLTWKIMRLGDFVALKQFYAEHRAIEFLWLHPSRGLTYKTRFVSSPISSSEDGKSPFVAQVEVTLQIVELAPTEQEQPSASDLMETINIGADKAVQAAIDAEQARDEAGGYAQKAAASAKEAADTAAQIPAAVETGIERIEAAGTSQVTAVKNAGSEQVTKVKAEGQTQTAAAKAQADAAAASAEEAAERLAEFKDLGATAKTLAAGSNATASFDSSTGVITIGVPIGDKGDKGDKGDPGTFSEDGVTVVANASGEAMAKDVAIGGDVSDLASARGQVGDAKAIGSHDFSSGMLSEKPGMYTAIKSGSTNVPFTGPFAEMILGSPTYRGSLLMTSGRPTLPRAAVSTIDTEQGFSGYNRLITEQQIGDGLTVTNGIISVPEYDGATASTAGTSGLVPPATAGQQDSFLTGGGEYKPALPLTGGTMLGSIQCGNPAQFVVGTQEAPFYQMRAKLFGVHSPTGELCGIMTADAASNYFSIEPTGGAIVNSYCGRPGSAFQHGYFANMNGHPLAATIIGGASGEGWFYRRYSDGFIEQCGIGTTNASGDTIITLPTAFASRYYNLQTSFLSNTYPPDFYGVNIHAYSYSTVSFYVEARNGQNARIGTGFSWYACGF